jgi:predicted PhzF superfamily epimerase YddE/YHI9
MKIPYFHIDAFTRRTFGGNYAGVCVLPEWLPGETLLKIAAEVHNETAFLVPDGAGYAIRWFTPATEVDLCGHATLSAGYVVFNHLGHAGNEVRFSSGVGTLVVRKEGEWVVLDFPARPAQACPPPEALLAGLGAPVLWCGKSRDYLALLESEAQVRALKPDIARLAELECLGIIATAPGEDCDFVSRFFAPRIGFDEDPVTGSAHSTLIPFWSARLGKKQMAARQVSARGGDLRCEDLGERVLIGGQAVTCLKGEFEL